MYIHYVRHGRELVGMGECPPEGLRPGPPRGFSGQTPYPMELNFITKFFYTTERPSARLPQGFLATHMLTLAHR